VDHWRSCKKSFHHRDRPDSKGATGSKVLAMSLAFYPVICRPAALKPGMEDATLMVRPVLLDTVAADVVLSQHLESRELLTRGPWSAPECGTHL